MLGSHRHNQMVHAAKNGASEIAIRPKEVMPLARRISQTSLPACAPEVIAYNIRRGNVSLLGVKIRIIGQEHV